MKITESIHIVGGASYGLSHNFDCNVYLIDFKDELIMIDAGSGVNNDAIIRNIKKDGLNPKKLLKIF